MKYYHIWFQTKHKKYILVDIIDTRIHVLLKQIAKEKEINLLASGSLPDHIHLLLGIEDGRELSIAVKLLKGISSRRIFQEYKLLKRDFRTNNLWARKFGYKEVPPEELEKITNYVTNQKKDLFII